MGKSIQADLFERIYDSPGRHYSCRRAVEGPAEYWEVPVSENSQRVVHLEPATSIHETEPGTSICIFHDIEENIDTNISPLDCRKSLAAMLDIEKRFDIKASYNVLGTLFRSKRDEIWGMDPSHSLAFHSFNHDLSDESQLVRCREVDLQVRGYRPPRSVITAELTEYRLSYLNFEWIASGESSLDTLSCCLHNGMVRIPILTDDYPLVAANMDYGAWESELLECARNSRFIAFGLHDCYAPLWLHSYPKFLEKLHSIGTFVTADQVCDQVFWLKGAELSPRAASPLIGEHHVSGWRGIMRWSRRKRARAISRLALLLNTRRPSRLAAGMKNSLGTSGK